jgi:hypothetical protein
MTPEMPWGDDEPLTKEDAAKRLVKRIDKLNKGICGDLWKMHQECHKQVEELGNADHLPMTFVRYQEGDKEDTQEHFYVCRKCISDYIMAHPEALDSVSVLRGTPTKECRDFMYKRAEEQYKKDEEATTKRIAEEQKQVDTLWTSDKPCPICGKGFKDHTDADRESCTKQYNTQHPPDEKGGTNKP